jgi:eukaryotic-like serine/threonine-protein kinase
MSALHGQEVHDGSVPRVRALDSVGRDPIRESGRLPLQSRAGASTLAFGVIPMPSHPASPVPVEGERVAAVAAPAAGAGDPIEDGGSQHREGMLIAGKYLLLSLIGEGGMGTVWQARNVMLDVDVALKVIRREIREPSILERFVREARASARLQHPSIVRVYDCGTSERGEPFMVMELLQGTNLGHRLDAETRIEPVEAVTLLLPIAAALSVAHEGGVVHRDLKPDNVFLADTSDGCTRPVIMDFGIAKLRQASSDRPLTGHDALVGTPEYMSPEQLAADGDVDARSDVWGFCVLLYEVVAGRRPFEASSSRELFAAIVAATPPSLHEIGAADARLSDIVRRGLAKRREERWASMRELGAALAQWAADAGVATDASGVTLERWSGVAVPSRVPTLLLTSPIGADDRTPPATSVHASVAPVVAPNPAAKPRRAPPTALLAATLGVVGLVLGGWASGARPAEGAASVRAAAGVADWASFAAQANPGEAPAVPLPAPVEARALPSAESESGPTPASASPRPQATTGRPGGATVPQQSLPLPRAAGASAPASAAAQAWPEPRPTASPARPGVTVPASRVPATPNF